MTGLQSFKTCSTVGNDTKTREILQEIPKQCSRCQKFSCSPVCFKFLIPVGDYMVFEKEFSIDQVLLERNAVLHIVGSAKRFSDTTLIEPCRESYGEGFDGIWLSIVMRWGKESENQWESVLWSDREKIDRYEWTKKRNIREKANALQALENDCMSRKSDYKKELIRSFNSFAQVFFNNSRWSHK